MNGIDSKYLIGYFKKKNGKYLKLDNGKKVKLFTVVDQQDMLTLTFTYSGKDLVIPFELSEDCITIYIPDGLEQGCFGTPIVKFNSFKNIGKGIEKLLTNWTERNDEFIELDWED